MKYIFLILGGALGTLFRFMLSVWITGYSEPDRFPWGTFTVNLLGSLVIGILAGIYHEGNLSINLRMFLFIGLLGGFTTFSSFSLECLSLLKSGQTLSAVFYILGSNIIGILLAAAGYMGGQYLNKI